MKYRVTSYLTLAGPISYIDLADCSYGEWIVYENARPKFHVALFGQPSRSNQLAIELISKHNWSIEKIIKQISLNEGIQLNLGKRPLIEIVLSTELKEIQLPEMPINWLEKLVNGR